MSTCSHDPRRPRRSRPRPRLRLEVEIDASSIDTNEPNRDAHLRSGDVFGVDGHPTISFRSTAAG